jgi:hypothetical protein
MRVAYSFEVLHEGGRFETRSRTRASPDSGGTARQRQSQPFQPEADVGKQATMGSPEMEDIRWLRPVRPGGSLSVEATVLKSVASVSRPDRGRATTRQQVKDQNAVAVMTHTAVHVLRRRPGCGLPATGAAPPAGSGTKKARHSGRAGLGGVDAAIRRPS